MKRYLLWITIAAVALTAASYWIFFKAKPQSFNANDPGFLPYVSGFTSGMVSKSGTIKLRLSSQAAEQIAREGLDDLELFSFEPELEGTWHWLDERTLEFRPAEPLEGGQTYLASFALGDLLDLPSNLERFNFSFQALVQRMDVRFESVQTASSEDFSMQSLLGEVKTTDTESAERVASALTATQGGRRLPVSVVSAPGNTRHSFRVDSVRRGAQDAPVRLRWDGEAIEAESEGQMDFEVPPLGVFKLLNSAVVNQPEQYVRLVFSDPLDETQDLEGMVQIIGSDPPRCSAEGNVLKIYPSTRLRGTQSVRVNAGLLNSLGAKLPASLNQPMDFEEVQPALRFLNNGTILPSSPSGLVFPFEAVNLKAVDVVVERIYEENVLQFLQVNELDGDYEIERVGKVVLRKVVRLDEGEVVDFSRWNRFYLDLGELMEPEPGAIYRIHIGFRIHQTAFDCADGPGGDSPWGSHADEKEYWEAFKSYFHSGYNYWDENFWENQDNPCHQAYYGYGRAIAQNLLASDIGLLAKSAEGEPLLVFANDLLSTEPLSGATIRVYDFQRQVLAEAKTDSDGKAVFQKLEKAAFVVAEHDGQSAYLIIQTGNDLNMSHFAVDGVRQQEGMKGYLYGDRGVWRPGDSLFISFVLQKEDASAARAPLVFEFRNPMGQVVQKLVQQPNAHGLYTFRLRTAPDAPTGAWEARVVADGAMFNRWFRIETVKPNRLKINMEFAGPTLSAATPRPIGLEVAWLHGAVARNLKATVTVDLEPSSAPIAGYEGYRFEDPTADFSASTRTVFEGELDEQGKASFLPEITLENAPGMLRATFTTKAFEPGGDFSIWQEQRLLAPFQAMVGVRAPQPQGDSYALTTGKPQQFDLALLDAQGKPIAGERRVRVQFYKVEWSWWWESHADQVGNFRYSDNTLLVKEEEVVLRGGKGSWRVEVPNNDWGRYVVLVKDLEGGHMAGQTVYFDWDDWQSRPGAGGEGAAVLSFSADKDKYEVGQDVEISFPSADNGRTLVSIEKAGKVLKAYWIETDAGQSSFKFEATPDMAPNVYVSLTHLQPHAQTLNNRPIRMYGTIPVLVEDPATHLNPVLTMPNELRNESRVELKVAERDGRPMAYTVALVDVGLLDLTRFRTPDPWAHFYAKEALTLRTWDLYDEVIGAFGGEIENFLTIGGDGELDPNANPGARRFEPMVRFIGPFFLEAGKTATHSIEVPNYLGAVRAMVVASHQGQYGSAEKTVPVVAPLMALASLPRVLGPGEKVQLPVTLFAMKDHVRQVKVEIRPSEHFNVIGASSQQVSFSANGEQTIFFDLEVEQLLGVGKLQVVATSGNERSTFDIELDVRNPNSPTNESVAKVLAKGESWEFDYEPLGIAGTNAFSLEVSSVPPINLSERLGYLTAYPHGCLEQVTSAAFPQLFVGKLMELDAATADQQARNVRAAIERLARFQLANGGMAYWPGATDADPWGTSYATHFLLKAREAGYTVPSGLLDNLMRNLSDRAKNWTDDGPSSQLVQAYRLYALALAGKAESGAMNRLRELTGLSPAAQWRLAAAFALSGKAQLAKQMVLGLATTVPTYTEMSVTYGSDIRDLAMMLETLNLLKMEREAFGVLKQISDALASERWLSTQSTGYALQAVAQHVGQGVTTERLRFAYQQGTDAFLNHEGAKSMALVELASAERAQRLRVNNTSGGMLFVRVVRHGVPAVGQSRDQASNLELRVSYTTLEGEPLDVADIEQGTDFFALVSVRNPGSRGNYSEMALSQVFPSGWEILNSRMFGGSLENAAFEYQDIRDDRVLTYFDLEAGQNKTFRIQLNATYPGRFFLPAVYAEAMYDNAVAASKGGQWVEVSPPPVRQ